VDAPLWTANGGRRHGSARYGRPMRLAQTLSLVLLAWAVLVVAATFLSLPAPGVRNRRPPDPELDGFIVDAVPA
jgi:hypothetical protein